MDLVLRNAKVVDGTGAAARSSDVGVDGDRIVAVGDVPAGTGAQEMDLDGLVLAPGFVDIHTHYDAQILWDPDLTPSSWHGVTSVVMGNCGFGIAPTRPEHRELMALTLENVEGMSIDALRAGITWSFETFPEYLQAIAAQPARLNVGALIGHTPLRTYVMGEDATERAATREEIAEMRRIVREALGAGALGFSSSAAPTHSGAHGKPVPSRLAAWEEVRDVAGALGDAHHGVFQATGGRNLLFDQFAEISISTGRPVTWTAVLSGMGEPGRAQMMVDLTVNAGGEVYPQVSCRELVMSFTLADPFPFAPVKPFEEVLAAPHDQRAAVYADPDWRNRTRPLMGSMWGDRYKRATVQETGGAHPELVGGPTMEQLATQWGSDPFDVLCDLALADGLATRFRMVLANDDVDETGKLLQDPRTVLGLSDAGAHASQLCDANFSTHLLSYWVRELGVLSLEQAVWRLSGQAAHVLRLDGRGTIAEGAFADLVAFDPDTVGTEALERVWDLPGGADRLVAHSTGVVHTWVNGTAVWADGAAVSDARPGMALTAST